MSEKADQPVVFDVIFSEQKKGFRVKVRCVDAGNHLDSTTVITLEELARLALPRTAVMDEVNQKQKGEDLFHAVFDRQQVRLFDRAWGVALGRGVPLILRLRFLQNKAIHEVPWELLHDGFCFLAKDARCSVVRYLESERALSQATVESPLRILMTTGAMKEADSFDLDAEKRALERAYDGASIRVLVTIERRLTLDRLMKLLSGEALGEPYHIWHHYGHGTQPRRNRPFKLILENSKGDLEPIDMARLSELVRSCPNLHAIFLGSCHSGAFESLAPSLAQLDVPVVVGFPWAVGVSVAQKFGGALHCGVLTWPLEVAASQARRFVSISLVTNLDWSYPLIFSRRRMPLLPLVDIPTKKPRKAIKNPGRKASGQDRFMVTGPGFHGQRETVGAASPNQTKSTEVDLDWKGIEADAKRYDARVHHLLSKTREK